MASAYSRTDPFVAPLVLTSAQEFALLDASEPDQIDAQLKENTPELYLGLALPERHDFILRHSASAKSRGIVATHELTLYCALALMHGERFASEQPWRALLEQVEQGRVALADAVAAGDAEPRVNYG